MMKTNQKSTLDIITVNWNSGYQLRSCLESIRSTNKDKFTLERVIVIDNASIDGSANGLNALELPLIVKYNTINRGFAAACNQGAKGSDADYLLFVNPDIVLFENSLSIPLAFMEQPSNQDIGIVSIQLVDDTGTLSRTCARIPTPEMFISKILGLYRLFPGKFPTYFMNEWDHEESMVVDHVMGAFFLVRRTLFGRLSGFDERYFVYLEDLDFSLRAKQLGRKIFYLAEAQAFHKGGGISAQVKARRLFYSLKSRILFGFKHFSWWSATCLMFVTLFFEPLSRLVLGACRHSREEICDTLKGYYMLWSELTGFIKLLR